MLGDYSDTPNMFNTYTDIALSTGHGHREIPVRLRLRALICRGAGWEGGEQGPMSTTVAR